MKILAIDFGFKNLGLALSEGNFVEPLGQIKFKTFDQAFIQIVEILKKEKIERIILGINEGKIYEATKKFGRQLQEKTKLAVILEDESFTSLEARKELINLPKSRKKRRNQEHQVAACLLLENFLARMKKKGGVNV